MRLSEGTPNNEATPEPGAPCDMRSTETGHRIAGTELLGARSAYDNPLPSSTTGGYKVSRLAMVIPSCLSSICVELI